MVTKNKIEICGLFPTPLYLTNINRKFTKQELSLVKQYEIITLADAATGPLHMTDTKQSEDNYILNQKEFKQLKIELQNYLCDYINTIICPNTDIKCYITQSWLNYTKSGEHHHEHNHSNCFLSGVLYFNADENFDSIVFDRNFYNQIKIKAKEYNLFNSDIMDIPVKTGQLLIFPSYLKHYVNQKRGDNIRISLSFNTFLKGILGNKEGLTELELK